MTRPRHKLTQTRAAGPDVKIGLGQIMVFGGILAAGTLGYHLLESGQLLAITMPGAPSDTQGPGVVKGAGPCPGPFASLPVLIASNPQIVPLMNNWQNVDAAHSDIPGASRYSWPAFRTYATRLGYPDPGPQPPQSFCPSY